jgi:hypothetical protein
LLTGKLGAVDHINAYATSTPVGDKGEIAAPLNAFDDALAGITISATKSATAHLLGAAGALSTAVMLDLLALSVAVMPIGIVLQRAGIVLALGLIAIGSTDRATRQANEALPNDWLVVGGTLWVALLGATLMGWI